MTLEAGKIVCRVTFKSKSPAAWGKIANDNLLLVGSLFLIIGTESQNRLHLSRIQLPETHAIARAAHGGDGDKHVASLTAAGPNLDAPRRLTVSMQLDIYFAANSSPCTFASKAPCETDCC